MQRITPGLGLARTYLCLHALAVLKPTLHQLLDSLQCQEFEETVPGFEGLARICGGVLSWCQLKHVGASVGAVKGSILAMGAAGSRGQQAWQEWSRRNAPKPPLHACAWACAPTYKPALTPPTHFPGATPPPGEAEVLVQGIVQHELPLLCYAVAPAQQATKGCQPVQPCQAGASCQPRGALGGAGLMALAPPGGRPPAAGSQQAGQQ